MNAVLTDADWRRDNATEYRSTKAAATHHCSSSVPGECTTVRITGVGINVCLQLETL